MAHPGGRPLKWETPEMLEKLIDDYFKSISYEKPIIIKGEHIVNRLGEKLYEIVYIEQPTITGLALYLDSSRKVLMSYEYKDEFGNAVKKAKTMIENTYEKGLMTSSSTGAIFALKNFGWTDKQEFEGSISNGVVIINDIDAVNDILTNDVEDDAKYTN